MNEPDELAETEQRIRRHLAEETHPRGSMAFGKDEIRALLVKLDESRRDCLAIAEDALSIRTEFDRRGAELDRLREVEAAARAVDDYYGPVDDRFDALLDALAAALNTPEDTDG